MAGLMLAAGPATADEVWSTDLGDIIYEAEEAGAAILSFGGFDGYRGTLVLPGLAGNYEQRGVHHGYWIGTSGVDCGAALTGPTGNASRAWGQAVVAFDGPAFPTSFTVSLGDCFGPLNRSIRAVAR